MKRDVAKFVAKCILYLKVKVEHLRLCGMTQEVEFPMLK